MKHFVPLLIILTAFVLKANAQPSNNFWIQQAGSPSSGALSSGIATDASGNVFITGVFESTITFGMQTLVNHLTTCSNGCRDIFIAKYDTDGNLLWVQQAGGIDNEESTGITTDVSGNVFITGSFQGTAIFGTDSLTASGFVGDIFIAKYNTDGNLLWVQQAGGTGSDESSGISTDISGNVFITGDFRGTATFGTDTLTSFGSSDIFIAKYNTDGNILWVQQAGGIDADGGHDISTDIFGNVFITGSFTNTATFDTQTLTSFGGHDIFIAKYDADGNILWVRQARVDGKFDSVNGLTTDASGNAFITGFFERTATFGTDTLTSFGFYDIFITKYDTDGNFSWVRQAGGMDADRGHDISTDISGNVFIIGDFDGIATFGTQPLTNFENVGDDDDDNDVLIAKYDTDGNFLWVQKAGGVDHDAGEGVTIDASGNILITGEFSATAIFGTDVLTTSFGRRDIFIAKLSSEGFVEFFNDEPVISSIVDVPNDQGQKNFISWTPSIFDPVGSLNQYGIWSKDQHDNWFSLGSVPALQTTNEYTFLAPTLRDSIASDSSFWSSFRITSHTFRTHFTSEIDSGYSVDNLAPAAPTNPKDTIQDTTIIVNWDASAENDFNFYTIYRDVIPDFEPFQPFAFTTDPEFVDTEIELGVTYYYRITATDFSGNESRPSVITDVKDRPTNQPTGYSLEQNYPNPFNPTTTIPYQLARNVEVSLKIYDMQGQEVRTLVNAEQSIGPHEIKWNGLDNFGRKVSSGIYIYKIQTPDFVENKRLLFIK